MAEFASDVLRENMSDVHELLISSLSDENMRVRMAGMKALVSLLLSIEDTEMASFTDLIPIMFEQLNKNSNENSLRDELIAKTCDNLTKLATNRPQFFGSFMSDVIVCLSQIINENSISWETKRITMELLLNLTKDNIEQCDPKQVASELIPLGYLFFHFLHFLLFFFGFFRI